MSTSLHALEIGKVRHFPGTRVALTPFMIEKMPRTPLRFILKATHRKKK